MGLNLNCLPDDTVLVSGLSGDDTVVLEPDAMSQVDALSCHGQPVQMIKMDIPIVFLHPGVNQIAYLINADLPTLTRDTVHSSIFYLSSTLGHPRLAK
jgi:hypothetical protein